MPISLPILLISDNFLSTLSFLEIGIILSLSPNTPTYPSSEHFAVKIEDRLSISAIVTEPYSVGIVPHALPELSVKQIVLPDNCGMFAIEMSTQSSRASSKISL